jgi:hypothetical protein
MLIASSYKGLFSVSGLKHAYTPKDPGKYNQQMGLVPMQGRNTWSNQQLSEIAFSNQLSAFFLASPLRLPFRSFDCLFACKQALRPASATADFVPAGTMSGMVAIVLRMTLDYTSLKQSF